MLHHLSCIGIDLLVAAIPVFRPVGHEPPTQLPDYGIVPGQDHRQFHAGMGVVDGMKGAAELRLELAFDDLRFRDKGIADAHCTIISAWYYTKSMPI
jgi:hypothetical protein